LAAHAQFGGDLETMQRCYEWYDLKSEIESLRSRAEKAEAERDDLQAWVKDLTTKISGAIGLGSEMFRRHGEQYRIDPDFVAGYIRDRREDHHNSMHRNIMRIRELQATCEKLAKALEEARETNRKLHRRLQLAEAVQQSAEDYLGSWLQIFTPSRKDRRGERHFIMYILRDAKRHVDKLSERYSATYRKEASNAEG
jgi:chromosome segregation ATPase